MGIHYKNVDEWGKNIINISDNHPLVYLDTWAINYYCSNIVEGERFVKIMTDKKATLAVSDVSVIEIGHRSDTTQIENICNFLQTLDIALIDTNPKKVIEKEIQKSKGNNRIIPWVSDFLLETYERYILNPLQPLSICKLFKHYHEMQNKIPLNNDFENKVNPLIEKKRNDASIISGSKNEFTKLKSQVVGEDKPIIKLVWELVVNYLIINKNKKLTESEWRDIQHLIVPVSYCDFILLDKEWIDFLKQANLKHPKVAKSYSKNQISDFHDELKAYYYNNE